MKKLKLLVFEHITGGGLNKSELPESLANEGLLMLQSLINDLAPIETVEVFTMLDFRLLELFTTQLTNIHIIDSEKDCYKEFNRLVSICDAVWPIAPESDWILQSLCEAVKRSGKILLTSSADSVAIAGNKWLTYEHLCSHSIATIPTQRLVDFDYSSGEWMVKVIDGVGCADSYLVSSQAEFETLGPTLDKGKYIIQPHYQGEKTSLSCLFKKGRGWLLCANRQHFELIDRQYHLTEITVNFVPDSSKYVHLVKQLANAMPGLWGYAGIDLIETSDEIFVLEINPRLTTSYAGIHEALGINCANAVLDLMTGEPQLQTTRNQPVNIQIKESHVC